MAEPNTISLTRDVLLPFGAVLFGGLLSLLGTYLSLSRSHKLGLELSEFDTRRMQAVAAYSGFLKLVNSYNEIANAKREIDKAFEVAATAGAAYMEPWAKVKQFVGHVHFDEPLGPQETSFLISSKNAELMNRAHLIQRRAWNVSATLQKYSELRDSMDDFLIETLPDFAQSDGVRLSGELTGKNAKVAEMYASRLNNLIGQLLEQIEADEAESFAVASEFKEVAAEYFGEHFPDFRFGKNTDAN